MIYTRTDHNMNLIFNGVQFKEKNNGKRVVTKYKRSRFSYILYGVNINTFHSNGKCSLLKILCNPTRLCEGTPLQPLRLDLFRIDFPSHTRSQLLFLNFQGQNNITRGKEWRAHECAPLPNLPTPETSHPTPSTTYPPPR